jgi:hypothetical protein
VREIRRRTRRKFAPEEKVRIVLEELRAENSEHRSGVRSTFATSLARVITFAALNGVLLVAPVPNASGDDVQLWTVVTVDQKIVGQLEGGIQTRVRLIDDVSLARDVLLRPFLAWQVSDRLDIDLGYDYLHSLEGGFPSEHRIWQMAEYRLPLERFDLSGTTRLDQRFVEDVNGVVVRLRFRARATYQLPSSMYLAASDEVFLNLNDRGEGPRQGLEQNRVRAALGWTWKRTRVEAAYEWHIIAGRGRSKRNLHVFAVELSLDREAIRAARRNR